MIRPPTLKAAAALAALSVSPLWAADFSHYRGFQFGDTIAAAAKQAGMKPSEARLVHERPAVIEELDWRPVFPYEVTATQTDPLREALLRFYNGQLFQIVITYDRQKVEGMTEADMVKAISVTYGAATKPGVEIPYRSNFGKVARVIARWENSEYCYNLIPTGDQESFALLLSFKRLDALAQTAIVEALRLDLLEAPQRAIDAQRKQQAKDRLVLDKARSENLPNFRP